MSTAGSLQEIARAGERGSRARNARESTKCERGPADD